MSAIAVSNTGLCFWVLLGETPCRNIPVQKVDNVGMAQVLEDANLLLDHVLVALDGLLEDNLDSHIVARVKRLCLLDSTIGSGAYCIVFSHSYERDRVSPYVCECVLLGLVMNYKCLEELHARQENEALPKSRPNS